MTEQEWATPGDLKKHVDWLWAQKRKRKLRLFGIACCRQLEPWMDDPILREALLRAEQFADGELSDSTIDKWRRRVRQSEAARRTRPGWLDTPHTEVYRAVQYACLGSQYGGFTDIWRALVSRGREFGEEFRLRGPALAHQLLCEVFGNPFRPVAFAPEWRTSTVVALAQQMYGSQDFSAMPILADALQDAGCDNAAVLEHCRGPGPHVRGCWVVDSLLDRG